MAGVKRMETWRLPALLITHLTGLRQSLAAIRSMPTCSWPSLLTAPHRPWGARMADAVTIAEWPRNSRETLRVRLDQFNGRDIIDVRSWYEAKDCELKPGRAGICLAVSHLPRLVAALTEALEEAERRGLIERSSA